MKRLIILCGLLLAAAAYAQPSEPAVNYYAKDGTVQASDGTVYSFRRRTEPFIPYMGRISRISL